MFRLVTTVASLAPLAAARGPASTLFARNSFATMVRGGATEFETLATPAPGSPFHYAFPVHDLNAAKEFYGIVLGCVEGRSSEKVGSSARFLQSMRRN
jgi:catechol 2,3-dioxygenase-like lactoylglutathione lyase family enzyme